MQPFDLVSFARDLWTWATLPALVLATLVLTVALRAPQLTRLAAGLTALRGTTQGAGATSAGLATILAAVGSLGAAAAVGVGTAIALGGPGAIAWVWLFGFLLAPLRYAEVLMARTDAPGRATGEAAGSLSTRLMRSNAKWAKALGFALAGALVLTAFAFVGGVHGQALHRLGSALSPDSAPALVLIAALAGGVLAAMGRDRAASLAGWLGLVGLVVVVGCSLVAAVQNPSRAFASLVQALADATQGSPVVGGFTGALAAEIARSALTQILPSLAATTGVAGALHAGARGTARGQAAAALYDPFLGALFATLLGVALVSTGAFYQAREGRVPITETTIVTSAFASVSQRQEVDRLFTGYMRIRQGQTRDSGVYFATERGMIEGVRFLYSGRPADVAIHFEHGRATRIQRPGDHGALTMLPMGSLDQLTLEGRMLPRGAELVAAGMERGTGTDTLGRVTFAGLLGLMAAALAAWGFALRRAWPRVPHVGVGAALGLLPALGITLELVLAPAWLPPLGTAVAGIWVMLGALALLLHTREISRIAR